MRGGEIISNYSVVVLLLLLSWHKIPFYGHNKSPAKKKKKKAEKGQGDNLRELCFYFFRCNAIVGIYREEHTQEQKNPLQKRTRRMWLILSRKWRRKLSRFISLLLWWTRRIRFIYFQWMLVLYLKRTRIIQILFSRRRGHARGRWEEEHTVRFFSALRFDMINYSLRTLFGVWVESWDQWPHHPEGGLKFIVDLRESNSWFGIKLNLSFLCKYYYFISLWLLIINFWSNSLDE